MNRPLKFLLLGLLPWLCLISFGQVEGRNLRRWRTSPALIAKQQHLPTAAKSSAKSAAKTSLSAKLTAQALAAEQKLKTRSRKLHLPGEFERQSALLISCQQMLEDAPDVFVAIAAATHKYVPLIALVDNVDDYRDALALLKERKVPTAGIHFLEVDQDSMWIRDYGPCLVKQANGSSVILDADYSSRGRPLDDAVPMALAAHLGLAVQPVPQCIDGGNLLHNGWGLAIATETLLWSDEEQPPDEPQLSALVKDFYGFDQLVLLEALEDEPTGHVDMFAAFVSPQIVVVGEIDPAVDLENSQRLDRNAARLAGLKTEYGRLRVVRIPMPPCDGPNWRSYTNVVFANGVLLVPVFPDADEAGQKVALETFANLLPGWRIVPIDSRALAAIGGGLHCVTMNLAGLPAVPKFPLPVRARPVREGVLALEPKGLMPLGQ